MTRLLNRQQAGYKHWWNCGICVSLLMLLSHLAMADTQGESSPSGAIEVVSIRPGGIDLRIRNLSDNAISIGVCDTPQRLSGLAFQLELSIGKEWKPARPSGGVVLGDFPPKLLQIEVGKSVLVPALFSPQFMGIKRGATIRVVVTVWLTETGRLFQTQTRVASAPFAFLPANHDQKGLIYYEKLPNARLARRRASDIRAWDRAKKIELINSSNPEWKNLLP